MGNTEEVLIEGQSFRVFRRLPIPIAREVQQMLLDAAENYTGSIEDLESGKVKAKDAKNIDLDKINEIYDYLLIKAVLSPKITKADIDNIENDFQFYYQELADLLLEKFQSAAKKIKKKSSN